MHHNDQYPFPGASPLLYLVFMGNLFNFQLSDLVLTVSRILLVVLLALLATRAIQVFSRRLGAKLDKDQGDRDRLSRLRTLMQVLRSATYIFIYILTILTILYILGVNVVPFLAGAGLIGLVLSFGAQALVGDVITGILLLVEDQFRVGDVLRVGDLEGRVERITQRVTYLRAADGRLHVVPHGAMRIFTNLSRDWSLASADLEIPFGSDFEAVLARVQSAMQQAQADPGIAPDLLEAPQVANWTDYKDGSVKVRLSARVRPGRQAAVGAALRRYAVEAVANEMQG